MEKEKYITDKNLPEGYYVISKKTERVVFKIPDKVIKWRPVIATIFTFLVCGVITYVLYRIL